MWFRKETTNLRVPWEQGHQDMLISRDSLLEDAFARVQRLNPTQMKQTWRFSFVGEPGLDAGGVAREFFEVASAQLFSQSNCLFEYSANDNMTYQINPAVADRTSLPWYKFAGRLLGKALIDRRLTKAYLTLPLFKHIVAAPFTMRDLEFLDAEVYNSLTSMAKMDDETLRSLCLDFTVTQRELDSSDGTLKVVTRELKPNGEAIDVCKANLNEFTQLRLKDRMLISTRNQLAQLLLGVYEVLPQHILSVFDSQELELLLIGVPEINMDDWKSHTVYAGEYGKRHPVIKWFWEVVMAFGADDKAKLLQFVTGTSRVPVHGFEALQGSDGRICRFTIVSIECEVCVPARAPPHPHHTPCVSGGVGWWVGGLVGWWWKRLPRHAAAFAGRDRELRDRELRDRGAAGCELQLGPVATWAMPAAPSLVSSLAKHKHSVLVFPHHTPRPFA
jgi:hypothetical protein